MKKTLIIFCLLTCSITSLFSQTSTYLNNYVQPAPNAASLGKFVDYPVGYYTGVPNVDIPIVDVKDGGIDVPVSISYHASGIRVSELASWVGLGWALNAGGVLIRTVRGAPDEGSKHAGLYGPIGYYASNGLSTLPKLPYPDANRVIQDDDSNQEMYMHTIPQLQAGDLDGEPDLFTFNFNGHGGKFVFDENRTPRLLTDDNIKILANFGSGGFTSWEFITPDGLQYYFGENGKYEVTQPHSTQSGDDGNSTVPSSWYLTRVINPNTKDTAYFYYDQEIYAYRDLGPESSIYPNMSGQLYTGLESACDNSTININLITTTVTGLRLDSIKTKNYTVVFVAKTQRQDLLTPHLNSYPYKLDSIKLFNSQQQCIKQFLFNQSYFTSKASGTAAHVLTFLNQFDDDSTDAKRLKLVSLTEYSGDGTMQKPPYLFTYDESMQLPRRLSYDQDHWGFSNNSPGNSNIIFTPPVSDGICTNGGGGGANRDAKWPDMSAFSLIGIQDPIGEKTTFQFEANNVSNVYGVSTVGGLRIKQISTKDSVTGKTQVRKFSYNGGGVLYKMPKYLIEMYNEFYPSYHIYGVQSDEYFSYGGYLMYGPKIIWTILKQSQSIVPLQDAQGNHIGYPFVTETFGPNGEGGSKVYRFQVDFTPSGNSRLNMSNYTADEPIKGINGDYTGIFGNGHFNDIASEDLSYYTSYDVDQYYPYAPQQVDLRRGRLLGEYTYDSAGNLLQSVENAYDEKYHEDYSIRGFKVSANTIYVGADSYGTGYELGVHPQNHYALTYYKLHTGISHLDSTVTTAYKDGKIMRTVERYGYLSAYHTLVTNDTTVNSEGDSIINTTDYSFDYSNTVSGPYAKMKIRNLLLPIKKSQWKNNKLVSSTITQYKDFASSSQDTLINPLTIYALETTDPLTAGTAGMQINLNGLLTTLIPNSYFDPKASFNYNGQTGKVSKQTLTNDKSQSVIWDNTYNLPLAVIDNADTGEVAFTSFENNAAGNWSFNSSSIIADNTAPTGSNAYTLSSSVPISRGNLNSSKSYTLSYWLKSGGTVTITGTQSGAITGTTIGSWTYHQVTITGISTENITGSGRIDEVRLYPSDAQMTTYTYDSFLRLVNQCSVNSTIAKYEYDALNELIDIKDQYGNITKAFHYNYGGLSR